mgnify:CR=1 FL=1
MINVDWDKDFLDRWARQDKDAMLAYTDAETYRDAGQGGFEIRTFIAAAAEREAQGPEQTGLHRGAHRPGSLVEPATVHSWQGPEAQARPCFSQAMRV